MTEVDNREEREEKRRTRGRERKNQKLRAKHQFHSKLFLLKFMITCRNFENLSTDTKRIEVTVLSC